MSKRFLGRVAASTVVAAGAFLLVAGSGVVQASTPMDGGKIDPGITQNGTGATPSGTSMTSCGGNTNTTLKARNEIESGDVNGGDGGSVTVTLINPDRAITLHIQAGDGGDGGESGQGQGADQAEDLGEYAGQTNPANSNNQVQTSTAGVDAVAPSGDIKQGVRPGGIPSDRSTGRDRAITLHLQAGDGGNGGETGQGQGADQAEDLGEYAGQTNPANSNNQVQTNTAGVDAVAPPGDTNKGVKPPGIPSDTDPSGTACDGTSGNTNTSIDAVNSISSGSANGGNGGNIYIIINPR